MMTEAMLDRLTDEPPMYKILTNNEDRILCVLRWCSENGANEVKLYSGEQKSSDKAIEWINFGNKAFSRSSLIQSSWAYSKAIMYAVSGSKDLARAYANRSATACEMNMYNDSLKDIKRALAIGYPDNLKAKLYIRQIKCLWGVHRKMCPEIKSSIVNAEKWIKKADDCDRNKLQCALKNMNIPDILKGVSLFDASSKDAQFMVKTPANNPKILRASKSIKLKYSDEYGRHLVAAQDINAGQVLFVDKAFVSMPLSKENHDEQFISSACWNCSKTFLCGVPCPKCVNGNYCDEKCRDEDWNNYHEIDCPIISQLLPRCANPDVVHALRMTIKALKEAGSFQKLHNKLYKIDSITDPVGRFFAENLLDNSKYASVYALVTDNTDYPHEQAIFAIIVLKLLCRLTNIFGREITKIEDIIAHEWAVFVGSLVLRNLQILDMFGSPQDCFIGPKESAFCARTVYPLLALCNHSCDANVCLYFHRNHFAVIAMQKISSDEQIVVSYNDINFQKHPRQYRKEQLHEYGFWCTCIACKNDWKLSQMKSYKNLSLSGKKAKELQILGQKLDKIQFAPDKNIEKQLLIVKDILNLFDASFQYSCVEFFYYKSLLGALYRKLSLKCRI